MTDSNDSSEPLNSRENAIRLLEDTHAFPCPVMVKVIGRAEDGFVARIVAAVRSIQKLDVDPEYRMRQTPNGRHVAVTFEPYFKSAVEVLVIYEHIRTVEGVVMLL
ncbi:MAG: DUF493 domain-containing protein [Planctomycetales bacterium]|nr:DUF493 domain-containing protein [Planctomycetales bacterium]